MNARKYEMRVGEDRLPYLATVGNTKIREKCRILSDMPTMWSGYRKNTFI